MQPSSPGTGWGGSFAAMAATTSTLFQPTAYTSVSMATPPPHAASPASASTAYADERMIDAKMAVAEARTDTKFAQLLGELKAIGVSVANLGTRIDEVKADVAEVKTTTANNKSVIITTVIASALAAVGLAFAATSLLQGAMGATATAYQSGMAAAQASPPKK